MSDISIIIPVYNVEKYIYECIDSVLNQTYTNFELILVDDGSTDKSSQICDDYKKNDERISVIHQINQGLSAARNTGLIAAKGEYIFFLDSDDIIIHDNDLEQLNSYLNKTNPDFAFVLPEEYNDNLTCVVKSHDKWKYDENILYHAKDILSKTYNSGTSLFVSFAQCKIIRADFCKKNKLFFKEGIYHEDDEWVPRVLKCNPTVVFLNQVIYGYRRRENSIIRTSDETKIAKKSMDKMSIAISTLQLFDRDFHSSDMIIYYIQYYLSGCLIYKTLHNEELKCDLLKYYLMTSYIFKYLKQCDHYKFKAIYWFYKLFGKSITFKLLMYLF